MSFSGNRFRKLTVLSAAGYIFVFALAAKGVFLFAFQHPRKENLLDVEGVVTHVRLGGQGRATWLRIETDRGNHRYSSYYGKVWPGMERIRPDDRVRVLAERKKLNRNELISGSEYYIWELIHQDQVIVAYDDVRALVKTTEANVNRYVNALLAGSIIFLLIAGIRQLSIRGKEPSSPL